MNSGEQSVREIKIKNLIRVIEKAMDKASAYSSERDYAEQFEKKETEQENFNTEVKNILNETNKKFRSWCIDLKKNDLFDFFKNCTAEACGNYFQGILTQLRECKSKFDQSSKTIQDAKTIYNRSGSNKFRKKKRWRGITIIILFPLLAVLLTCFNIKFEEPVKDLGIILQALFFLLTSGDGLGIITTWASIVREVKDDNEKGIQYGEQRAATSSVLLKNEIGYNVMAESLSHSCYSSKENAQAGIFSREYASRIKKKLQDGFQYRHVVFISAVSKDSNGQPTKEFKLAQILRDKLKEKNIGVFWWEDDDVTDSSITVSTKIAMGLSCSTFFVGLSFGDRSKICDGCDGDEFAWQRDDRYKFFKYEINTFLKLSDGHNPKPDYICGWESRYFPKSGDRICLLYTDAYIANIPKSSPFYDRDDVIHSVDDDDERIVNGIVAYIETKINNKLNEGNKHYKKIYNWIHKHSDNCSTKPQDSQCENRFLYDAFDPNEFARGNFMDHFLGPQWEGEAWIRADSKENIDSIPIDYFFQYAIVDEAGRNAKNHFLVFPERYNDGNGNFKWRMKLVIRDWNLRALQDVDYRRFLLGNISYNPRPKTDMRFPLSDYSVIKFYKDKNLFNHTDDRSFDEHATCQIYSDNKVGAAQNLTECNSGNENHCAFILYDDMLNEVRPTYHLAGSLQLCNAVSANDGKYFYISVMFYPKPWEYNITRVKLSTRTKTARCPYCGRIRTLDSKLAGDDIVDHSKYCYSNEQIVNGCRYQTCEYNFIGKFYPLDDSGSMKRSKAIGGSKEVYGDFSGELLKEYENMFSDANGKQHVLKALPNNDIKLVYKDYKDGIVVTVVGVSRSGKSTFISRMLGVYSEGDYEGDILCDYLNNALKPYVGKVEFAQVKTLELFNQRGQDIPNKHGINGIRLLEDYKTPKYQQFLKQTQNEETDPILTHTPFTVELRGIQSNRYKESFVSFFDLPGGLFESSGKRITQYHKDFTMLYQSDSIILLLSDDQREVEKIQTMLTAIKDVNEDTVIAIVFCKSDILFGNTQYHWDKVRSSSPVAKGNKFNGSKRQRYIDECSKEIEDRMKRHGSALMKKTIDELTTHFAAHHKFFAVSALGRGDSIIRQDDDNKYTLFETSPLNIENVLLWIMFEKGIIE